MKTKRIETRDRLVFARGQGEVDFDRRVIWFADGKVFVPFEALREVEVEPVSEEVTVDRDTLPRLWGGARAGAVVTPTSEEVTVSDGPKKRGPGRPRKVQDE